MKKDYDFLQLSYLVQCVCVNTTYYDKHMYLYLTWSLCS